MSLLRESNIFVFRYAFSIAVPILMGIPIDESVAPEVGITDNSTVDFGTVADSTDKDNTYMPLKPGTTFYC